MSAFWGTPCISVVLRCESSERGGEAAFFPYRSPWTALYCWSWWLHFLASSHPSPSWKSNVGLCFQSCLSLLLFVCFQRKSLEAQISALPTVWFLEWCPGEAEWWLPKWRLCGGRLRLNVNLYPFPVVGCMSNMALPRELSIRLVSPGPSLIRDEPFFYMLSCPP